MELKYLQEIAKSLNFYLKQIDSIAQLHSEGSTIAFIARYRKEATGNLDEVQITDVIDKIKYFAELEKRKETVIKTIEGLGKLTPELKLRIENCVDATEFTCPISPSEKPRPLWL